MEQYLRSTCLGSTKNIFLLHYQWNSQGLELNINNNEYCFPSFQSFSKFSLKFGVLFKPESQWDVQCQDVPRLLSHLFSELTFQSSEN